MLLNIVYTYSNICHTNFGMTQILSLLWNIQLWIAALFVNMCKFVSLFN